MKKSKYAKEYGINRVKLDKMIHEGELTVEQIDGTDYVRLKVERLSDAPRGFS